MKTIIYRLGRYGSVLLLLIGMASVTGCGKQAPGTAAAEDKPLQKPSPNERRASPGPDTAAEDKALRKRHAEFIKALFTEDFEACVRMSDPTVIQARGADTVKGVYQLLGGLIKAAKLQVEDVRIDGVTINEDATAAQVRTSNRENGEWKEQAPSQWIRRDSQWFLVPAI
jgi:hypothetical protein